MKIKSDNKNHPYFEEPDQKKSSCLFCHRETEEQINHKYFGVALDEKEFPIPAHFRCYRKYRFIPWIYALIVFVFFFTLITLLLLRFFYFDHTIFDFPFWIWIVTFVLALFFAILIGLYSYSQLEDKIVEYKRSHTDYEDHYKSDRLKWRR